MGFDKNNLYCIREEFRLWNSSTGIVATPIYNSFVSQFISEMGIIVSPICLCCCEDLMEKCTVSTVLAHSKCSINNTLVPAMNITAINRFSLPS